MKNVCIALLLGLPLSANAQHSAVRQPSLSSSTASAASNSNGDRVLVLNGKATDKKVVTVNGKRYVALDDLVEILNASVSYPEGSVALTIPISNAGINTLQASGAVGRIKGTLTYFFNNNYGNRPDVGSSIALLKRDSLSISQSDACIVLDGMILVGRGGQYQVFRHTAADGSGNFDIEGLPAGNYVLVVQSKHANGNSPRDISGKVKTFDIKLEGGQTFDASADFGTAAF